MSEEEKTTDVQKQLEAIPPYARSISTAMVILGQAVGLALSMRDVPVLTEMRRVCDEIFQQAEMILKDQKKGLQ